MESHNLLKNEFRNVRENQCVSQIGLDSSPKVRERDYEANN